MNLTTVSQFVRRIRDYYATIYGAESPQVKTCQGGYWFEPKVAERVFNELLAGEKNIRLILNHRVVSARVMSDGHERDAQPGKRMDGAMPKEFGAAVKLVAVSAEDLSKPGAKTEFRAKTFIDCTYEGALAAMAGVPYRVGRASRDS